MSRLLYVALTVSCLTLHGMKQFTSKALTLRVCLTQLMSPANNAPASRSFFKRFFQKPATEIDLQQQLQRHKALRKQQKELEEKKKKENYAKAGSNDCPLDPTNPLNITSPLNPLSPNCPHGVYSASGHHDSAVSSHVKSISDMNPYNTWSIGSHRNQDSSSTSPSSHYNNSSASSSSSSSYSSDSSYDSSSYDGSSSDSSSSDSSSSSD